MTKFRFKSGLSSQTLKPCIAQVGSRSWELAELSFTWRPFNSRRNPRHKVEGSSFKEKIKVASLLKAYSRKE